MGWRIVYIEESEQLSLYLDNLKVKREIGDITIPIVDIQTLIIDNYKLNLSVQLLNKLAENNVNIIFCGIDHLPKSFCLPFEGYHASSLAIRKQITWKKEIKSLLHQKIVQGKIKNQLTILQEVKRSDNVINKLKQFVEEVEESDITNREGLAARLYFWELYGKDFIRFEDDVVNAGLNYGYSILRSKITSILVSKGLNTCLGLFHRGPTNSFNLSDDIIEVFRPIIDHFVYLNLKNEVIFKKDHRDQIIKLVTEKIIYDGQYHTISNAIGMYVDNILKCIENDTLDYFVVPSPLIRNV